MQLRNILLPSSSSSFSGAMLPRQERIFSSVLGRILLPATAGATNFFHLDVATVRGQC